MFYGIISVICLLGGSILLGQGIHKDDIRIVLPSITIFLIGMVVGILGLSITI